MRKRWNYISSLGVTDSLSTSESRSVILANKIAGVLAILSVALTLVVWTTFGFTYTTPVLLLMLAVFISIPLLNKYRHYSLSRFLISNSIPVIALTLSIVSKNYSNTEIFEYFDSRIVIILSSVIPVIIFPYEERSNLIISLTICFLIIVFYDPIHNMLGMGFYQKGFSSPNYHFINFISILGFLFLVGSVLFLKVIIHENELERERLIYQLNEQNADFRKQNEEMLEQRHELMRATNMIEDQKEELSQKNQELELLINKKTQDLIETNKELVKHNNELQQFSYTISHNLRAPVASLIGLTNIFDAASLNDDNKVILDHLHRSAESLDKVFRDLNKVLELRNSVSSVKEKLVLSHEISEIKQSFEAQIEEGEIRVIEKYDLDVIYTIRPFLNSILYNLVSNAIKYRNKRRKSFVRISSFRSMDKLVIKVEDNGLGMDIEQHKSDMFKMYKRFHEHTEGKGLGLYLAKLQTEALGGKINVESRINEGTVFTVTIKFLEDIHNQTVEENEYCRIYYDAFSDISGILWKKDVESEKFKDGLWKSLEVVKIYHTPNLLFDFKNGVIPEEENRKWLFKTFFPEVVDYGVKNFLALSPPKSPGKELVEFLDSISEFSDNLGSKFVVFHSTNEAKEWIAHIDKQ